MFPQELGLGDLVNLAEWQKLQDSFSEVVDVSIRTISTDGVPLSSISRATRLCGKILPRKTPDDVFCKFCPLIERITHSSGGSNKPIEIKCLFGLDAYAVPITAFGDRIVAYIVLGPVILKSRKHFTEYEKDAKALNIPIDEIVDALVELSVFSYSKMSSIISLAKEIFNYMAQSGYHKRRLGEIAPEVVEMDPNFARYYEEKVLNSLLSSCTLALDADSGSVMTLDKKTNILHIKASSKLDDNIVNNTNVKMGEGIAGLAAQTAKPIILPQDEDKSGISDKLKRKYIKSSMVVPFNKGTTHDVYGVLNLNIMRRRVDFSERDIALVKELVKMASLALAPLQGPQQE